PLPLGRARKGHAEPVERTRERVRDDVLEVLGAVVEGRHRRQQDGAHLDEREQAAKVSRVERRLPDQHDEGPALLQRDVGRARDRDDQPLHRRNRRRRTSSRVFWYITSHSRLPSGAGRAYEESVRRTSVSIVSSSLASSESARMTSVRSSSGALTVTASDPPSSLTIISAR